MINDEKTITLYKAQLLKFILSKIQHKEDAEDILSKVFIKLLIQDKTPANPIAWLYQVTKNQLIDYYRTQHPTVEIPHDLTEPKKEANHFFELSQCLLPMIKSLKVDHQRVIELIDIEGIKQQQAAEQIGISLPALKSRLLRARQELKDRLVKCCPPKKNKRGLIDEFESSTTCDQC